MGRDEHQNIAIVGFMGAGKSTVGGLLASRLHMEAVDLDEVITARAGRSVSEIFAEEGEDGFREIEHRALWAELERDGRIISCGGGVLTREDNLEILRDRCHVFYIKISPRVAVERLQGERGRPLLEGKELAETVQGLMAAREERYIQAAHEVIRADDLSPEEIAKEIAGKWRKYGSGRREENTGSS